jgi:hypothetical protein
MTILTTLAWLAGITLLARHAEASIRARIEAAT